MKTSPCSKLIAPRLTISFLTNSQLSVSLYKALLIAFALFSSVSTLTQAQSLSVSMPFPGFRSSFITGTPLIIQANATAPPGETIAKVEFFLATFATGPKTTTKLGEDLTAPFSYTWTIPDGQISYNELSVKVTSSTGATAVQGGSGYNRVDVYAPATNSNKKYYVKEGATAGSNGLSPATPFATIQSAVDLVQPGDSVFVMAGTYRNSGTGDAVIIRRTGTAAHGIVFTNYQNDKPKISFTGYQGFNLIPGSAYITIRGFDIEGNNANITLPEATTQPGSCENPGTALPKYNGNGISVSGRTGGNFRPHHIVIANNVVHDCAGAGISAIESDYITVENNTVYNNAWYTIFGASGISFLNSWNYDNNTDAPRMIIRNNRCYGNRLFVKWNNSGVCQGITDGNGIILDNNNDRFGANPLGAYSGKFLLENNLTYQNGGRGININYSNNTFLINNTSYQNAASPEITSEFAMRYSDNARLFNNIFSGRPDKQAGVIVNSLNLLQDNNLVFGSTGPTSFTGGQNQTGVDPQFVDTANGNFQLASSSPAINAGNSTPGQYAVKDILGVNRPQGSGVDIGAYEFQGTPTLITQQPASSSVVCAGTPVSVSVSVDGPVQTYQWYKDGSVLTGITSATTATLSLSAVAASDQGSYYVVVTSFNSLTSTAFNLTVNAPPTVGLSGSGTISCLTPTVTLTATSGSGSNFTYNFSTGATQLDNGNTATVSQAGTYSVLVTSADGCTASASVEVSGTLVTPDAPAVSSVTVTQGAGNVTLTVSNCSGTVNWNGTDGATSLVVSTSAVGEFVYSVTCKVGVCVSPVTSVTVSVTALPASLRVYHRDADNNQLTNNTIRPYLNIYNDGSTAIPYSELTVRYWLTVENFSPLSNLSVYWAQLGTSKVKMKYVPLAQPRQGALGYVEYSFDASAGSLAGNSNSGQIQTGVGKQNWTNFAESDDYSFTPNGSYTQNDRITIYRNGTLVGGVEPAVIPAVTTLKVYSENKNGNPNSNQISTHLKLANEGNVAVDYSQLTVRYWFSSEGDKPLVYTLDYAELGNNIRSRFIKENRAGTDTYLELSFGPALSQLNPLSSTGIIQQRINKNDWSTFNEANDFSYKPAGVLSENTKITAYLNGSLIYGQEPPVLAGARIGNDEFASAMQATVLGNPLAEGSESVDVEVRGVEGQSLWVSLTDVQGRLVSRHQVVTAGVVERCRLPIAQQQTGIFLVQVRTQWEKQTIKVLK
ncbi:cellulose binding domain-containing protein [Spirosoma arcticum]